MDVLRAAILKQVLPPDGTEPAAGPGGSSVLRASEAQLVAEPYRLPDLRHGLPPSPAAPEAEPEEPRAKHLTPERVAALRAEWEADARERHAAELERVRADAFADGQAAVRAELEAAAEQERAALKADFERLREQFRDYLKKTEPLLANLAFDVAQQLLSAPLPQDVCSVSTQALTQALESFRDTTSLEILLHPDDLVRLEAFGFTDDIGDMLPNVRWKTDDALELGDWIVQSPEAAVRRLKQELLTHLKSRFGLLSVVRNKEKA